MPVDRILFAALLLLALPSLASPPAAGLFTSGRPAKVTLHAERTPLRTALRHVLQNTPIQLWVGANVPDVPITLSFRELEAGNALRLIGRAAAAAVPGLTSSFEGPVFVVRMRVAGEFEASVPPTLSQSVRDRPVTVDLDGVPLRRALAEVFEGTGVPFSVDPPVPDVPITLTLRAVGLQTVLRLVLRHAAIEVPEIGAFTADRVLIVALGRVPREPVPFGIIRHEFEAPEPPEELRWEKISLRFARVEPVASALGVRVVEDEAEVKPARYPLELRTGIPPELHCLVGVRAENALLAYGPERSIAELREMVRMIDQPRKRVRIRISSGAIAAEGLVESGAALRVGDAAGGRGFSFTVSSQVAGARIEISIQGTLTARGRSHAVSSRLIMQSGEAVRILTVGTGSRRTDLWLRATY